MPSLLKLASFALVLSFVPTFASADEPTLAEWAQRRVEDGLVKPLAQQEAHSFSRARPPARARRVRVLATTATLDKERHGFVPYAIDVRWGGDEWHENDLVGCAYQGSGKLFVKIGDGYRPAAFLLGKDEPAVPGACEAAPKS